MTEPNLDPSKLDINQAIDFDNPIVKSLRLFSAGVAANHAVAVIAVAMMPGGGIQFVSVCPGGLVQALGIAEIFKVEITALSKQQAQQTTQV